MPSFITATNKEINARKSAKGVSPVGQSFSIAIKSSFMETPYPPPKNRGLDFWKRW